MLGVIGMIRVIQVSNFEGRLQLQKIYIQIDLTEVSEYHVI